MRPQALQVSLALSFLAVPFANHAQWPEEAPQTAETTPRDPMAVVAFVPIGTTSDAGFFSLRAFGGRLLAGTYGTPKSYAWDGVRWQEIREGDLYTAGESLFDMVQFSKDGMLYGATESSGKIFRFDGSRWERVFQAGAEWNNAYSIVEYKGTLFTGFNNFPASNKTLFVRSTNGRDWLASVLANGFNHPRFGVYQDTLYVIGSRNGLGEAWSIPDPASDEWQQRWGNMGQFTGKPFVWKNKLYVGVQQGRRRPGAVYSWDGATLVKVLEAPDEDQVSLPAALHDHEGALYVITAVAWRAKGGTAKLYRTYDGVSWEKVWAFPEPEGWTLEVYEGALYAGTRREGGGGKVYRMVRDSTASVP